MTAHYPKVRIRVPEKGLAILTTVEIDGQPWPATRVSFDSGEDIHGFVGIRLEFVGEIDFESEAPLVVTGLESRP